MDSQPQPLPQPSSLRIVFLGTPDFAVASLDALVNAGFNVVGVVTAPDRPAGRGMKLQESAVKKYAVEKGLLILQPEKLRNPEFLEQLRQLHADLQVVVAFRMLPEVVWNMPPMGTVNVHASLLPQYRGAAPINWAIINGEVETGVTTFKLKHEIDTGNILMQEKVPIGTNENAGELHDRLKSVGANLLVKTVSGLAEGSVKEQPQHPAETQLMHDDGENAPVKHAPKIFTETCRIDWSRTVDEVHNLIRGLSPHPGAFTMLGNKMMKIYRSEKEYVPHHFPAGEVVTDNKTFLKFACDGGFLHIKELQLEGKKKMDASDYLRGHKIDAKK